MSDFGKKMRELRMSKFMSIHALSVKTDLNIATLSKIETGKTEKLRNSTLAKIAAAFDMPVVDFAKAIGYTVEDLKTA